VTVNQLDRTVGKYSLKTCGILGNMKKVLATG